MRLSSAVSLDYETVSLYHLVVIVSDGVNTDISATLTVTVNDLFDIDPEILNLQDAVRTDPVIVEAAEMTATPLDIFLVGSNKMNQFVMLFLYLIKSAQTLMLVYEAKNLKSHCFQQMSINR